MRYEAEQVGQASEKGLRAVCLEEFLGTWRGVGVGCPCTCEGVVL